MLLHPSRITAADGSVPWPAYARIPLASHLSGLSRSEIYRRLAARDIIARKNRSATLVDMESVRAFLASLPAANIRTAA